MVVNRTLPEAPVEPLHAQPGGYYPLLIRFQGKYGPPYTGPFVFSRFAESQTRIRPHVWGMF